MSAFRRFAPFVTALLVALVAVQTLDVVPCADEGTAVPHTDGAPTGHDGEDDGGPHEKGSGLADCLCHVVFTRTEHLPEVAGASARPPAPFATLVAHPTSVPPAPLDHVPLA